MHPLLNAPYQQLSILISNLNSHHIKPLPVKSIMSSTTMNVDSAAVRRHQKRVHLPQQRCCCGSSGLVPWVRADMGNLMVPWSSI